MPTTVRLPDVQVPGTEQLSRFGSKYADEPGSDNLAGVKSPAVDAILRKVLGAQTREQLVDATHALDRVLMNGYYVIPHWYSAVHRIAYRNNLAYPAELPLYFAADEWLLSTWWQKTAGLNLASPQSLEENDHDQTTLCNHRGSRPGGLRRRPAAAQLWLRL